MLKIIVLSVFIFKDSLCNQLVHIFYPNLSNFFPLGVRSVIKREEEILIVYFPSIHFFLCYCWQDPKGATSLIALWTFLVPKAAFFSLEECRINKIFWKVIYFHLIWDIISFAASLEVDQDFLKFILASCAADHGKINYSKNFGGKKHNLTIFYHFI